MAGHSALTMSALARRDLLHDERPLAPADLDFEEVYEEHFDFVWRSVRQLGVRDASVDDAVQDVFVVVHRRLGDFEARSSVRTWLYGIAIRVARDHRRRARRKGGEEALSSELSDETPDPLQKAEVREELRRFDRLLDALDEPKREVFVLAEALELSAPEIAEILKIPLNTVYSRLRAARLAFEVALRDQEEISS